MKITTTLATFSLLTCFSLAGILSQLRMRYSQWDAAYVKGDAVAMSKMLASDFQIRTGSGKIISRNDYVASLAKGSSPQVYKTTLLRTRTTRGGAFAWTEELSQKSGEPKHKHRYRDFWKLEKGHWLLKESRTLGEE